jgi:hypothetical protein
MRYPIGVLKALAPRGRNFNQDFEARHVTVQPAAIPKRVSRFYGRLEFALDVLEERRVAFVHVSMLNDPFDPYCFFETDFGQNYINLLKHVKKVHPKDVSWFRAWVTPQTWGNTVSSIEALLYRVSTTSFVLSTSAPKADFQPRDNLYMWGHYGNGHRGLAIEFDTQALADAVVKHHEDQNGEPFGEVGPWAKIIYAPTFPPISAEHVYQFIKQEREFRARRIKVKAVTALETYYNRMTIIKSDVWQHENEWRLMWTNADGPRTIYKCPIGSDAVTGVFLGLGTQPSDRERIELAVRRAFPSAPLFQARKRHGDLALNFDRL